MTTVRVALGDRSYDVVIEHGLLSRAGALLKPLSRGRTMVIVADENVAPHLATLQAAMAAEGVASEAIVLPSGESTKSWAQLASLTDRLIELGVERGDHVVALGGGVIGDLVGFACAIVKRGCGFVQIPTTLLAQVDSSVGGKTGINSPRGKNLIGVFYQPRLVLADTQALSTLTRREFAAGYAEVAKYGLIDRPDFFEWLEANHAAVFAGGAETMEAVARCCAAKAAVVAGDEHEHGDRALLNLGHTFGHALESAAGYDASRLVHGEGVAIGMALAHRFSHRLGLIDGQDVTRVTRHLEAVGLPTRIGDIPGAAADFSPDALMARIAQDKKVSRGRLTFILSRGLGRSFIARDVEAEAVRAFLSDEMDARA